MHSPLNDQVSAAVSRFQTQLHALNQSFEDHEFILDDDCIAALKKLQAAPGMPGWNWTKQFAKNN